MALLRSKIVRDALSAFDREPTPEELAAAREWAGRASDVGFELQNESQLEQEFNRLIVQEVLGYRAPAAGAAGTMRVKQPILGGTIVDLALGEFEAEKATIIAPFELKGPKTSLDRIMPGRNKTPVQQAWDYAMDTPGARWVLLSNMREIRLYAFGHGRQDYEEFDLRKLGEPDQVRRLQLLLRAEQLLSGATKELLDRSAAVDREITDALYQDYRSLRDNLLQFVEDQAPTVGSLKRIGLVQRLLDRLLFIAFAEDSFLLPENSLRDAIAFHNPYDPKPKWEQVKRLFEWVDKGAAARGIPPYNGGLFKPESELDSINFPDHLVDRFALLSSYDFRSEVSVNILGHIFEQSIIDIEELHTGAHPEVAPVVNKRKREGVVYTPDFVTRFIIEQTIGKKLSETAATQLPAFGKIQPDGTIKWKSKAAEISYWNAYLERLAGLRIVDPACGSGAFLVAAFDYLHAEQKRVRTRLSELERGLLVHLSENADIEIITNNLFGVDVNAESVELTKLALWLKTAKRNRPLEGLDENIRHGNSLVDDPAFHEHSFDWRAAFPSILHGGEDEGFDVVIGNPPYVRMELVKDIKPYLQRRYEVVSDRADLYAYFFELGVNILKLGGSMGYISSSTFFRTGSGAPLRAFLASRTVIESVVDFGDLQVFEGVTTYPAIVTLRKERPEDGRTSLAEDLAYLTVRAMPDDLSKAFEVEAMRMPRARLGQTSWRFESDLLDSIRAKMAEGRQTLAEVFGAPLYGVKTGLNKAFILSRHRRDELIARDPRSAELLKPFLVGENCKRWRIESDDLWLIYTPKNHIEIEDYPAIKDHLWPWKAKLEARATKQKWWELQQAQANYAPRFEASKVVFERFQNEPMFSVDRQGRFINNALWCIPGSGDALASLLNSRMFHLFILAVTTPLSGGYYQIQSHQIENFPIPIGLDILDELGSKAGTAATELASLTPAVLRRLADLDPRVETIVAFRKWSDLSFAELQGMLRKRCKTVIPIAERDEWECWFNGRKAEAAELRTRIADAESEINARVYELFELAPMEIAAVEDSLALAAPTLGLRGYEAISAVEGLELSDEARDRISGPGTTAERRAEVARAHAA